MSRESAPDRGEQLVHQREIRHLMETITALRDEMEVVRATHADALQEAAVIADAEMRQLRETAAALRERLEESEERGRRNVQDAERAARDELEQLRETIRALRDHFEAAGVDPAGATTPAGSDA